MAAMNIYMKNPFTQTQTPSTDRPNWLSGSVKFTNFIPWRKHSLSSSSEKGYRTDEARAHGIYSSHAISISFIRGLGSRASSLSSLSQNFLSSLSPSTPPDIPAVLLSISAGLSSLAPTSLSLHTSAIWSPIGPLVALIPVSSLGLILLAASILTSLASGMISRVGFRSIPFASSI